MHSLEDIPSSMTMEVKDQLLDQKIYNKRANTTYLFLNPLKYNQINLVN